MSFDLLLDLLSSLDPWISAWSETQHGCKHKLLNILKKLPGKPRPIILIGIRISVFMSKFSAGRHLVSGGSWQRRSTFQGEGGNFPKFVHPVETHVLCTTYIHHAYYEKRDSYDFMCVYIYIRQNAYHMYAYLWKSVRYERHHSSLRLDLKDIKVVKFIRHDIILSHTFNGDESWWCCWLVDGAKHLTWCCFVHAINSSVLFKYILQVVHKRDNMESTWPRWF